jgi:perosamine synthetase
VIYVSEPRLDGNELAYLADCIRSGWISSRGDYVRRFEDAVAAWCAVEHGVATSSGAGALHLALLALEIGPGDEVILPALSYVASAHAVTYTGAHPVFVDVDPCTWNLDLNQVESAITPQTKAVMAVHLYGHPVEMASLGSIAEKYGLWMIEDACQAHGAEYRGRRVGGIGHVGCFSFYANKLITTGEGGMLVTDCDALAERARLRRNQGCRDGDYWHLQIGFNYRMSSLQAAVGLAQLERVAQFLKTRRVVAQLYNQFLAPVAGLTLYQEPNWSKSVCWLYSLLVEPKFGLSRDALIYHLACRGIVGPVIYHYDAPQQIWRIGDQEYPFCRYRCGWMTVFSLQSKTNLSRVITSRLAGCWSAARCSKLSVSLTSVISCVLRMPTFAGRLVRPDTRC